MKFLAIAGRNSKEIFRDPLTIVLGVAMPIALLFLFSTIGRSAPIEIFTPPMLAPAVVVFGFSFLTMFSATLLSKDRQTAFLARLLTAPIRPSGFIMAYILPYIPIALVQIVAGFAAAAVLGIEMGTGIFMSLTVLVPIALAFIGLGMILGSLMTENQIAGFGSSLIVVVSIFGGCWMDLSLVGGVFEKIGYALPFAHAVDAARAVIAGAAFSDITAHFIWVAVYSAAFFVLGIVSFAWKTRR